MATFTITTSVNIDTLASKTGGDTYNINGGTLTIDQDSRYGTNQTTSSSLGPVTLSATLGGTLEIDARAVRIIPFDTGSGTVPASNTTISQGGASGLLIGVYSALNVAPTAAAAAMPASGYIKIKQWNSVAYAAGALTGISANATAADRVGWIEIVGDDSQTFTVNRLNLARFRGDWFEVGTTDGTRATTYQIPSHGLLQYHAGVWVETGTSTDVYEFYPCAGTLAATAANVATDSIRGRVCWISTDGLLRFGHDGTNSTGGYIVPTGRRIRIPNIFLVCCTTAARTANVAPNGTLASRFEFATTGGGAISMDKVSCNWYLNFSQPYSVDLSNLGFLGTLNLSEVASPMTMTEIHSGQEVALSFTSLTMALCFSGGTFTNCTFTRATLPSSGSYVATLTDITGFTFTGTRFVTMVKAANTNSGCFSATRMNECDFSDTVMGAGQMLFTTCTFINVNDSIYYDNIARTTASTNAHYAFSVASSCTDIKFDGLSFGGLTNVQPYNGILSIGTAGCTNITLRNLGTHASPLSLGGPTVYGASWTRVTTTATVTSTAHGLATSDIIYVFISDSTAAITVAAKTITVVDANTFTFTCLNAGNASGTLSYYSQISSALLVVAAAAAANNVKVQRCYVDKMRSTAGLLSADNSSKNITRESCGRSFDSFYHAEVASQLNSTLRQFGGRNSLTAQTGVYGTHFFDNYQDAISGNVSAQAWTRVTTTATVTSNDHGLVTGSLINVTVTSSSAAIILGQKTITVTGQNTFTFTCLNAGSASGTLTFKNLSGRIGLFMNESTVETSAVYTIDSGSPAFTATGGLYMPTIGNQVTFTSPYFILGHLNFPIAQLIMAGGTLSNYDITYDLDRGSGFSGTFKNAAYVRAGGGGTNGSTNVTMTDTTGVSAGDYVFGTNIAPNAKVSSITNGTTIVVDIANIGTVSGNLSFNQLPSETDLPITGAKFKIKIVTRATNATAITSLFTYTDSTETERATQYSLETVTVRVTVKDATTFDPIQNARVYLAASGGGPSSDGTVILTGVTDASGILQTTTYEFAGDQEFTGRARRATSSPLYKTAPVTGTITDTGSDVTVFLIADE